MKTKIILLLFFVLILTAIVRYENLAINSQTSLDGKNIKIVFSKQVNETVLERVIDLLPYLDQAYVYLQNWTSYTPYSGDKITILYDENFFADKEEIIGWSGNPIYIKLYPNGNLEQDLHLYFHELTHDFTPIILWDSFNVTLSVIEGIADLGAIYLYQQFKLEGGRLIILNNTLTNYETDSPFHLVKWEDNHPRNDPYPSDFLTGSFFLSIGQKYGFNVYQDFFQASTSIQRSHIFGDSLSTVNSTMNYLVYLLSNSTEENLTYLFTFWGFPLTCDADLDGVTDGKEIGKGLEIPDFDGDGILDSIEIDLQTNPNDVDSDNDKVLDNDELTIYHSNPRNSDSDADGVNDYEEILYKTDPTQIDTDSDLWNDAIEIEIVKHLPILNGVQNNWFFPNGFPFILLIIIVVYFTKFKR